MDREYYRFNTELAHKLQQPFPRDMYFKKGSAAETRFDAYYAQLQKTWEVETATRAPAGEGQSPAQGGADSEASLYATHPRTTAADEKADVTSLERALDRTLYLFLSEADKAQWRLPVKSLPTERGGQDTLHAAASEAVSEAVGDAMDLWLVSKLPIAVMDGSPKTYILRAHILSGTPTPQKGVEVAWLTKEEAHERFANDTSADARAYWQKVQGLLDA